MGRGRRATVRPTLAHGLMVLAGLVTFVLVTSVLRDEGATVEVVIASAPVEEGTPAADAPLAPVAVDASTPLLEALARPADLVAGRAVVRSLAPGEPLLRSDLRPVEEGSGLRTVAVPVERLVVDGLGLRPGDRVDVIAVAADGVARYVVAGAEVARLPGGAGSGLARTAETATTWLTVRVGEDEALALASALGSGSVVVARSTGAEPVVVASAGVAGVGG